ncbi:MAG: hypothetical protein Q9217_002100, partial [Psora testacea]
VAFTLVIVSLNMTAQNLSNYLPPGRFETLTPEEVENAVYGSKFVFITEEFQLATLWLCKACLLILYSSMTSGLPKQHRLVKVVGGYCILGYIVTQVLFLALWCRPIQQYWQVPVDNSQCASYYHHLITASVFNISSDLMMLLIPLPLLIKARLPVKRKLVLCAIFSLGILVILAAILNRYYNFTAGYGSLIYLNWYAGEAATAVMVANIPHCWPILSRTFRLGSFKSTSHGPESASNRFGLSDKSATTSSNRRRFDEHGYIRSESEERIANAGAGTGFTNTAASAASVGQNHDVELGHIGPQTGAYIGTAVTGGGKDEGSWREDRSGTIIKTVSLNQTYTDQGQKF